VPKRPPRSSIEDACQEADLLGFTAHEGEEIDGEVMVDLAGYGELIELYYRRSPTGYLAFHHGFQHGGTNGDRIPRWRDVRVTLRGIRNVGQLLGWDRDEGGLLSSEAERLDWGDEDL
jgi:hypothetical protein